MEQKRKWKCVECGTSFSVGEWECAPGIRHQIDPVTFYILDAPYDPTGVTFRKSQTRVENCPPERSVKGLDGEIQKIPGGHVMFVRGTAVVTDAEQEYWLRKHGYGDITREQWEQVYFSPREKEEMSKQRIARKEAEVNELLDKLKAQAAEKPAPKAGK